MSDPAPENRFARLARLLARHRVLAIGLALAIAAAGGALGARVGVDPGAEALFLRDDPARAALVEFNRVFSGDEVIVVALEGPIFTERGMALLERLTEEAADAPGVASAVSLANVKNVVQGPVEVVAWPPWERVKDGDATLDEFRAEVLAEPLFAGNLVSKDGALAAIICELERREPETVTTLRAMARTASGDGFDVHVAGLPVERFDVTDFIARDQRVFVPLVTLVLALMTFLLFRQLWGVVLPLAVVGVSVAATMGIAGALGKQLNALTSMITPVVMVVAVAASVNICTAYAQARAALAEGAPRVDAVAAALGRIGVPCFLTTLTTVIGFASLAVADVPAIADFGLLCAAGVAVSYVAALLLLPPLLALEGARGPGTLHVRSGRIESLLAALTPRLARGRFVVLGAAALVAIGAALGVARLRVETDLLAQLPPESDLARATRAIDRSLAGVNTMEVLFTGPPGAFRRIENLRAMAEVKALLERTPGVAKTFSAIDFLARIEEVKKRPRALPADQERLDYALGLLDRAGKDAPTRAFLSADASRARLTARLSAMPSTACYAIIQSVRDAARRLPPGITAAPTGGFVLLQDMTAEIPLVQVKGVAIATALILLVLTAIFRSLRLGALAALPVCVPIVFVYGLMGWTAIDLCMATAMISSVVLGLGVDSTILFLSRYRAERKAGAPREAAVARMLETAGQSVSYSNLTLVCGFAVGVVSAFPPVKHFATLTAGTIAASYVGAVALLPALVFAVGAGVAKPVPATGEIRPPEAPRTD